MQVSLLADFPESYKQIAKWYFDEWASLVPNATLEDVEKKVLARSANRADIPLAFVVHSKGQLVAAADLKFRENANYPEYEHWLGGVYVDSAHRGQGIAYVLIEYAKRHARKLAIPTLYLQCESHNIALYQKAGFVCLHQAKHHNMDTTIMSWDVSD